MCTAPKCLKNILGSFEIIFEIFLIVFYCIALYFIAWHLIAWHICVLYCAMFQAEFAITILCRSLATGVGAVCGVGKSN